MAEKSSDLQLPGGESLAEAHKSDQSVGEAADHSVNVFTLLTNRREAPVWLRHILSAGTRCPASVILAWLKGNDPPFEACKQPAEGIVPPAYAASFSLQQALFYSKAAAINWEHRLPCHPACAAMMPILFRKYQHAAAAKQQAIENISSMLHETAESQPASTSWSIPARHHVHPCWPGNHLVSIEAAFRQHGHTKSEVLASLADSLQHLHDNPHEDSFSQPTTQPHSSRDPALTSASLLDQLTAPDFKSINPDRSAVWHHGRPLAHSSWNALCQPESQPESDAWLLCKPEVALEDTGSQDSLTPCALCFDDMPGLPADDKENTNSLQDHIHAEQGPSAADVYRTVDAFTDLTNRKYTAIPMDALSTKQNIL